MKLKLRFMEFAPCMYIPVMFGVILSDGQVEDRESALLRKIANLLDVAPGYLTEARRRASRAPTRK